MKRCVACGAGTEERTHEHVTVDVCPQQHGLWLDQRELLDAVRTHADGNSIGNTYEEGRSLRLAADRDIEPGDEVRTCPMCSEPMGSVRYAFITDVTVDVCRRHGVWLDHGELDQLEAWAAQRADPASAEYQARQARLSTQASGETESIVLRVGMLDWLRSLVPRR